MKSTFKHPRVYDDLLQFYRMYWETHRHLPRPYKLTTGEAILTEITECVRKIILANQVNKNEHADRKQAAGMLSEVRASLVVIRGMLTLGWGMKFISHGAFMILTTQLDSVEKQITRWHGWFLSDDFAGNAKKTALS